MDGTLQFIHTSKMFTLLTFFSFDRSRITMVIVKVLMFVYLASTTLFFLRLKSIQESEEIRPWDLADQMEEEARLEKLCQEDDPYCFSTYSGRGAFRHDPCGRPCP